MPLYRSLRSFCVDIIVYISMFALLGHLSVNFWERFIIQTELTNMKTSLHTLKNTVNKIGYAYDTLHLELTGLTKKTGAKLPDKRDLTKRYAEPPQTEKQNVLGRKRLQDIQTQATTKPKNHTKAKSDKKIQIFINKNKTIQHLEPEKKEISKVASTMTRGPLKSTGVGQNADEYNTDYNYYTYTKSDRLEKCCQDHGCQNILEHCKF